MEGEQMSECVVTPGTVLLYVIACILTIGLTIRFLMWVFSDDSKCVVMRPDHGLYYCGLQSGNNTVWGSRANAMLMTKQEAHDVHMHFISAAHYVSTVLVEVRDE
jgi:hypothetical protein